MSMLKKSEQRRYRRIALDLPARVIVNGIDEYTGRLVNISPGDLAVKLDASVVIGDAAIVYISGLDMFEGRIARVLPDGFALSFRLSRARRALLTENLMLKMNPNFSNGLSDRRTAPRHRQNGERLICRLPDGGSLFVRALDQSVDGIAVESQRRPVVGSEIHIGRLRAVIVRHTPRGFVAVYEHNAEEAKPEATPHLRAV